MVGFFDSFMCFLKVYIYFFVVCLVVFGIVFFNYWKGGVIFYKCIYVVLQCVFDVGKVKIVCYIEVVYVMKNGKGGGVDLWYVVKLIRFRLQVGIR